MLIVELPQLPSVSALNGNAFESVIICKFISLCGPRRRLNLSQRQVSSQFNRTNRRAISRYLKTSVQLGLLTKVMESQGIIPDVYTRGTFFEGDTPEARALVTMANSLWGSKGLLRAWPYPTAWGFGCMSSGVILCLAVLSQLDESISKKSLKRYLEPLVSTSTFNSSLKFLIQHHLVYPECGRLMVTSDWKHKIELLLESNSACNFRQVTGDARRRAESMKNAARIAKGKLSDDELRQLKSLHCVFKGCKRKASQQEHFPPKRYLENLDISTHPRLVWAICKKHNSANSSFIKAMPAILPRTPGALTIYPGADPMRIYHTAANYWLPKFYSAVSTNNIAVATLAAGAVFNLWQDIQEIVDRGSHQITPWKPGHERANGAHAHLVENSQLPLVHD